jgi:ribosomal protein S18 acetylase RimI-like enzyme
MDLTYHWRGTFTNDELNALHAEGFGHSIRQHDWSGQVQRHSLGWVCVRDGSELVGFVNVPWDGASHAFILDALVSVRARRQGVGTRMIAVAAEKARASGCRWLHADFEQGLSPFYFESCGFVSSSAGLIAL